MSTRLIPVFGLFALCSISVLCQAADRVALVIGNSKYEGEAVLRNPANDADAVEAALKELGFSVIKKKDLDLAQMQDAVVAFRRQQTSGNLGLFFYAGHGVQVKGENFLMPVGAKIREEFEVKRQCLDVGQVLDAMAESESKLKVVILDCCRDNPLARSWSRSSARTGLAAMADVPEGTLIAFSTTPGKTAADGRGNNSPYTANLVTALRSRPAGGLELVEVFREASRAVKRDTGQVPWLNLEASLDKYFLWTDSKTAKTVSASPAPSAPSSNAPSPTPPTFINSIGMKFVSIPAGELQMGTSVAQVDQVLKIASSIKKEDVEEERPQHKVRISKPLYLGAHEVTKGEFARFVQDQNYKTEPERDGVGGFGYNEVEGKFEARKPQYTWRNTGFTQDDDHPVVNLTWNDAVAFAQWLSGKEQRIYRLPTEAEWEYACRAGTQTLYQNGDDFKGIALVGNVVDVATNAIRSRTNNRTSSTTANAISDGYVFSAPVGKFRANAFGLFDMHGNVEEWCSDRYDAGYYKSSLEVDPTGGTSGTERVCRGGSWISPPFVYRSACRRGYEPSLRSYSVGFRLALSPPGK